MWRKVKTFFHVFQGSLFPQPAYYHKITKASFGFSLKYFVSLIFILNLIFVSYLIIKYNPGRSNKFLTNITKEIDLIPKEFVVNINQGNLFTNHNRPYFFWSTYNGQKKLLLVIDETANPDKINIYNTYILVTGREIVVKNDSRSSNTIKIVSLKNIGKRSLDKKDFEKIAIVLTTISKFLYFFYVIAIPCLIILLPFLSIVVTLIYLIIISLIVYLFFKTYYHKRIHFKKTLQLSFHAVTLPLILDYFLNIFQPTIPSNIRFKLFIPPSLAFLIILAIFVFAAVYEAYMAEHRPS